MHFRGHPLFDGEDLQTHVCAVEETFYKDAPFSTIVGYCARSLNYRKDPYKVEFEVNQERFVTFRHCSCQGGEDGLCKHTNAVYSWVNEEKTLGQTDRPLSWNTPAKYAQELYRETKSIHELYGGKKRQKLIHDFRPSEEKLNRQIARMKKHGLQVCHSVLSVLN